MSPMKDDFLSMFMGSAIRAKVLRVFVFEQCACSVARIAKRASVSVKAAAQEIKQLEKWGLVKKVKLSIELKGRTAKHVSARKQVEETWALNVTHKHAAALSRFVHEVSPIEHKQIVAGLRRVGRISAIVLSGVFVGDATRPADIVIAGDGFNEARLEAAIKALEPEFGREIRYAAFSTPEFRYRLTIQDRLLRDTLDFPHVVILDKTSLL